jgi:hypothetical protein
MRIEDVVTVVAASDARADLSRYAPSGNGVNLGMLAMPWGAAPVRSPGYALYEHVWDPFRGAPVSEATGGCVYFGQYVRREDFDALLRMLEVHVRSTSYLAQVARSADVGRDGFMAQLRIVHGSALELLGIAGEPPAQPLSIGDALWRFRELEPSAAMKGALGGDGDWADESLGFGFLVENAYRGVYRIWSRPWLCTK